MLTQAKRIVIGGGILFSAIQFLPRPPQTNPRANPNQAIEANMPVPASVGAVIHRACMNCHSYQTQWPWYSRVAPLSWFMTRDVENARKAMNFSRWSLQNGRRPELEIATLSALCGGLRSGRMPKWNYLLLHPEARVTDIEKKEVCAWAKGEIRELVRKKRDKGHGTFPKLLQTGHDSPPPSSVPLVQK